MQASRAAATLAAGVVVLAALFLLWRYLPTPDSSLAEVDSAPGETALQWRVGRTQQYELSVESSFLMTLPGSASGQAMQLSMDGILDFRTLEVDAAGAVAGMRFETLSLTIDGASDADVNRALESPFRVQFDHSGRPLTFGFSATLAQEHRDILENLVMMFQVIVAAGTSWQVEESNANGRYNARYSRTGSTSLSKQKVAYLPSIANGSTPEVASEETIVLDPDHDWITGMVLDERIVINDPGTVPVQVTNLATIELVGTDNQAAVGRWDFTASAVPDAVVDPRANLPALSPEEAQRQLVTNVRELDEADESRSLIIHRLRDLLLIDDQLPAILIETLRTDELSEQTRADLYLAFELAGTPASQAALASVLLDNNWPPMDAMRAIVALAGVGEPTEDTLATLWGLARTDLAATDRRDLPGTAALAIGSLGNGMRTSGESDYTTLRDDLLVSASGAIEPEQRAVFLYALGNTADPDPLLKRDLVSYLDDPSTEVRSAAAKTLARLGADQVAEELLLRVQQESSDQARASMAEALASWDEPTAQAMQWAQAAVQQEADERARYNIAVLLGNNMETFPENRRVLEMLLESEQSKRIRQKVANMLY
jgi:HEAT repeat protein